MDLTKPFDIISHETTLHVKPKKIGRDWVYMIHFPDATPILMVTKASRERGGHFWTSVPEGRQEEADNYGPLIALHFIEATKIK